MTALLTVLALLGPVVVHDSREASPLGLGRAARGHRRGRPGGLRAACPAGGASGGCSSPHNDQDRGIVRTGRHAGDWEMVQVRSDAAGRPVEAVYAQHSGAERCPWSAVEKRGGRPVVYVAHGSHAAYFRPGVRDRMWPDPNDEADGRGLAVRLPLEPIAAARPGLDALAGPLGRRPRRLGPGRDGLAARPGLPAAGPLERPGGLGAPRAAVHVRPLRRARRVRRARERDRGRRAGVRAAWRCSAWRRRRQRQPRH